MVMYHVIIYINRIRTRALADSGASVSLIDFDFIIVFREDFQDIMLSTDLRVITDFFKMKARQNPQEEIGEFTLVTTVSLKGKSGNYSQFVRSQSLSLTCIFQISNCQRF